MHILLVHSIFHKKSPLISKIRVRLLLENRLEKTKEKNEIHKSSYNQYVLFSPFRISKYNVLLGFIRLNIQCIIKM